MTGPAPRTLPPDAASAFFAMGFAVRREDAQAWADAAKEAGATDTDVQTAWRIWNERSAASVQTIGGPS